MNWINELDLLIIHALVLQETGGAIGVRDLHTLTSAVSRPFATFEGQDLYPDLFHKVAALIHSIIMFHPFVDGNKRVGLVAGDVCLRMNGHRLVSSEEVESFFWSIARGEQSVESIAEWLREHTEPLPEEFQ